MLRLLIILIALTTPVLSWNSEGHVLVSEIAWMQLSESCQREVSELLRYHPDDGVKTLSEAGLWPDQIRNSEHPFRAYSRPDWHYVDRLFRNPPPDAQLKLDGQILEQLERQTEILSDPAHSRAERALALGWIAHLVGDIHQPLHNSELYSEDFPEGDRGGNLFQVVLGRESVSLHRLWDSAGGRFLDTPTPQRLRSYKFSFGETYPPDRFTDELRDLDFQNWSSDGLVLAKRFYSTVRKDEPIQREALQFAMDTSARQLTLAGYRLAHLLERSLCHGSQEVYKNSVPVNSSQIRHNLSASSRL